MKDKKNHRDSGSGRQHADTLKPEPRQGLQVREYAYAFRLSAKDDRVLNRHRQALVRMATGFAELYYKYLFDNPGIARLLYAHESDGGDIGQWVRTELAGLFGVFSVEADAGQADGLVAIGEQHHQQGFKPVWIVATYHLFIDYLKDNLPQLALSSDDATKLERVLIKLLLRNLGLVIEGYWHADGRHARTDFSRLERDSARAEGLLGSLPYLFWSIDVKSNDMIFANPSVLDLYGNNPNSPLPVLSDTCMEDQQKLLGTWQDAVSGSPAHAEVRMSLAGGEMHWYRIAFFPDRNRPGPVRIVHCSLHDINHLFAERERLEQLATTDALTKLPNRAFWAGHLNMTLAASRRIAGSQVVIISLEINHLKMYNDTLGHEVGDVILRDVAVRLKALVRESDSLARLGGDQFGILLQPVDNARMAAGRLLTRILDSMAIPLATPDRQLCIGVSIGIACFPEDGGSGESLLGNAESAMQQARRNGLPCQYYDPVNDAAPAAQLRYSGQLHSALEGNEFELHYQPLVDIQTSSIIRAEALLRWMHPLDGTVMPRRIIPLAERLGVIAPLTNWVLLTALQQCRLWLFEGTAVPVSVNLSAHSFHDPDLPDRILWAINEAGLDGDSLEIEITEAALMQDIGRATEVLKKLSDAGVTIAIDDFGSGQSSLSTLRHLPINALKIDPSFIFDLASSRQDAALVRSIIELGHNLGFKVVAEGVESGPAWDVLNNLGCDAAQGFHICKPLSDSHFTAWLSATG